MKLNPQEVSLMTKVSSKGEIMKKLIFSLTLLVSIGVQAQSPVTGWTLTAQSPQGYQFTFYPESAPTFLTITPSKQDNGWHYAIWEQLDMGASVYAQDQQGIWWTVTTTDHDTYEPNCLSETGDLDKIRMALNDIISGKLAKVKPYSYPDCLSDKECAEWEKEQALVEEIDCLVRVD